MPAPKTGPTNKFKLKQLVLPQKCMTMIWIISLVHSSGSKAHRQLQGTINKSSEIMGFSYVLYYKNIIKKSRKIINDLSWPAYYLTI